MLQTEQWVRQKTYIDQTIGSDMGYTVDVQNAMEDYHRGTKPSLREQGWFL